LFVIARLCEAILPRNAQVAGLLHYVCHVEIPLASFLYLCHIMKKFLEKSFTISMVFGSIAVVLCLFAMSNPIFMLLALSSGFLGFILACLHIISVQRYEVKQAPTSMLLLSLFLNSVPLIYMMIVVTHAKHS
jgi:hypothetical protein